MTAINTNIGNTPSNQYNYAVINNAGAGRNTIITKGGNVGKIKKHLLGRNDIEIHNNPLNQNPDSDWSFRT